MKQPKIPIPAELEIIENIFKELHQAHYMLKNLIPLVRKNMHIALRPISEDMQKNAIALKRIYTFEKVYLFHSNNNIQKGTNPYLLKIYKLKVIARKQIRKYPDKQTKINNHLKKRILVYKELAKLYKEYHNKEQHEKH